MLRDLSLRRDKARKNSSGSWISFRYCYLLTEHSPPVKRSVMVGNRLHGWPEPCSQQMRINNILLKCLKAGGKEISMKVGRVKEGLAQVYESTKELRVELTVQTCLKWHSIRPAASNETNVFYSEHMYVCVYAYRKNHIYISYHQGWQKKQVLMYVSVCTLAKLYLTKQEQVFWGTL